MPSLPWIYLIYVTNNKLLINSVNESCPEVCSRSEVIKVDRLLKLIGLRHSWMLCCAFRVYNKNHEVASMHQK